MSSTDSSAGGNKRKPYTAPRLRKAGTLAELTQGFAGSVPDEQGGQTKRNPYTG